MATDEEWIDPTDPTEGPVIPYFPILANEGPHVSFFAEQPHETAEQRALCMGADLFFSLHLPSASIIDVYRVMRLYFFNHMLQSVLESSTSTSVFVSLVTAFLDTNTVTYPTYPNSARVEDEFQKTNLRTYCRPPVVGYLLHSFWKVCPMFEDFTESERCTIVNNAEFCEAFLDFQDAITSPLTRQDSSMFFRSAQDPAHIAKASSRAKEAALDALWHARTERRKAAEAEWEKRRKDKKARHKKASRKAVKDGLAVQAPPAPLSQVHLNCDHMDPVEACRFLAEEFARYPRTTFAVAMVQRGVDSVYKAIDRRTPAFDGVGDPPQFMDGPEFACFAQSDWTGMWVAMHYRRWASQLKVWCRKRDSALTRHRELQDEAQSLCQLLDYSEEVGRIEFGEYLEQEAVGFYVAARAIALGVEQYEKDCQADAHAARVAQHAAAETARHAAESAQRREVRAAAKAAKEAREAKEAAEEEARQRARSAAAASSRAGAAPVAVGDPGESAKAKQRGQKQIAIEEARVARGARKEMERQQLARTAAVAEEMARNLKIGDSLGWG